MAVKVYENEYKGWNKCVFITNGDVELVVTTAVGPRILRYAYCGEENVFYENPKLLGTSGGDAWVNYGGHRFWHAPEIVGRTYFPDNFPVGYELLDDGVKVTLVQPENGVETTMEITLAEKGSEVNVKHRLTNVGRWPIECAAWAITVMKDGGYLAVPVVSHDENGLLPDRSVVFWPYARYNDKRLYLGEELITLEQDVQGKKFKIGLQNESGVAAYFVGDNLFIKQHEHDVDAYYPDMNCSFESYTDSNILEVESLSPVYGVEPGECIEHNERWTLFRGIKAPRPSDEEKVLAILSEYLGK